MSAGQESSGRPVGETEGGATPGTASLSPVAPKFRVPGLFWEWGYLKRTGGRGAGVSKHHLLCFVTPRSVDSVTGLPVQTGRKSSTPLSDTRSKLVAEGG